MSDDLFSLNPKKLGFGLMRLPCNGEEIDHAHLARMIDRFLEKGYTYFDTAFPYHGGLSEAAVKPLLCERHDRASFTLATKMPLWMCKTPEDVQPVFDLQLERTGAGYFDFYLLHALSKDRLALADQIDAWGFIRRQKELGTVRHIGFSFHDTADVLEEILIAHPEMEFVQLQINFADWESEQIQSRLCYEVARKYNKPVIIMEPIKGGSLAEPESPVGKVLLEGAPDVPLAQWALRFAASLPGVFALLSGMSTDEQLEQNTDWMAAPAPLSDDERALLGRAVDALAAADLIPCTSCGYCVEQCPMDIQTPDMIRLYNNYKQFRFLPPCKMSYGVILRQHPRASECISCGACETICPQGIPIIQTLSEISQLMDN